jgi:outer membrane protein OmpA-like peptidoglycan-associated protein
MRNTMKIVVGFCVVGLLAALPSPSPARAGGTTVNDGYYMTVAPVSGLPGASLTVTGNGQYYTSPFSGDNCDDYDISATVTYKTSGGVDHSKLTDLGTADGNGDVSGSVKIPADAGPTSVTGSTADVQTSCTNGSTIYLSNVVEVTVLGNANPAVSVTPSRLVVDTHKTTTAKCTLSAGTMTSCAISVSAPNGTVIAAGSASNPAGTPILLVTVTVNAKGIKLAEPAGGVKGTVHAVITPETGPVLKAKTSLVLTRLHQNLLLHSDVYFAFNSAKVSAGGVKALDKVARQIAGAKLVECDGYTDSVGSVSYNIKLGLNRAKAVCAILGTHVQHTKSLSFGESHPVATNATAAGRAKNRRVVVKITN